VAERAQSWGQGRHDQALVGAERSRVGIWLGLCVRSKPDANTGTRSGEMLMVSNVIMIAIRITKNVFI